MLAHNKFLRARHDFYNPHRHQKEWQLWKRLLKGQEGYRVEDSDEPLDKKEEVREDMYQARSLSASQSPRRIWRNRQRRNSNSKQWQG